MPILKRVSLASCHSCTYLYLEFFPCALFCVSSTAEGSEGSHVEFDIDVPARAPSSNPAAAGAMTEAFQLLSKTATD